MPMPFWMMCSPIEQPLYELLNGQLADLIVAYRLKLSSIVPVERDEEGIILADHKEILTSNSEAVLECGKEALGCCATYTSTSIGRSIRFVHFAGRPCYALCVAVDRETVALDHETFGTGGWIVNLLSKLANRLGLVCSACAPDRWSFDFRSLDADHFVSCFKSGELLETGPPAIFAIRSNLLGAENFKLLSKNDKGYGLEQDGDVTVAWRII